MTALAADPPTGIRKDKRAAAPEWLFGGGFYAVFDDLYKHIVHFFVNLSVCISRVFRYNEVTPFRVFCGGAGFVTPAICRLVVYMVGKREDVRPPFSCFIGVPIRCPAAPFRRGGALPRPPFAGNTTVNRKGGVEPLPYARTPRLLHYRRGEVTPPYAILPNLFVGRHDHMPPHKTKSCPCGQLFVTLHRELPASPACAGTCGNRCRRRRIHSRCRYARPSPRPGA